MFNSADSSKPFRLSIGKILRSCAPDAPPVRAMNRENLNQIQGTIVAVVSTSGHFESVKAVNVVPETLTADVEALFVQWLPPHASCLHFERPYR